MEFKFVFLFLLLVERIFNYSFQNYIYKIKNSKNMIKIINEVTEGGRINLQLEVGYDGKILDVSLFYKDKDNIRIKIKDNNNVNKELPNESPFPIENEGNLIQNKNECNYIVNIIKVPFEIKILHKETKDTIFSIDTMNFPFEFKENYVEFTVDLPSSNLYGLGERHMDFDLKEGVYTLYNRDQFGVEEDRTGGKNLYGSHPMLLYRDLNKNFNILYLRNSFPMDVVLIKNKLNTYVTYKIVGGIIDLNLFVGDANANTVVEKYHNYLGKFNIPPFWSLGWHQSKWGYNNLDKIRDVIYKYKEHQVPFDTLWSDIDYMELSTPFKWFEKKFNHEIFQQYLINENKKYVLIIEPALGIMNDETNTILAESDGIFIKNKNNESLINQVWSGSSYFIDFFNPKSTEHFFRLLDSLFSKIHFNGIWLDMNEISTFENGQVFISKAGTVLKSNDSCEIEGKYSFLPGNSSLDLKTICPNSLHYNDQPHILLHNFYPIQQSKLAYEYLENKYPDRFPFILSRAGSPGLGKFAAHWSGDNYATYKFLRYSISSLLNSNLFGIPMQGSDICGFALETNDKLCSRWMQLGTLYPFARAHSDINSNNKHFWENGETLLKTSKITIKFRYSLLKYYYSLFIRSNKIGSIIRPIFFEYNDDLYFQNSELSSKIINEQFFIYDSLLVIPALSNSTKINAFFPKDIFFDLRNYDKIQGNNTFVKIVSAYNETAPIFLKEGKTLFLQEVIGVLDSSQLNDEYELVIALKEQEKGFFYSNGYIPALSDYNNKPQIEHCLKFNCMIDIITEFNKTSGILTINFGMNTKKNNFVDNFTFNKIIILGIEDMDIVKELKFSNINNSTVMKNEKESEEIESDPNEYEISYLNENSLKIIFAFPIVVEINESAFLNATISTSIIELI